MKNKLFSISLIAIAISLFSVDFVFSQAEQLTITTYYPSPYGVYNQLRANSMAVGSATAMPAADGTIAAGNFQEVKVATSMPTGVTYR